MSNHNKGFYEELTKKISLNYHQTPSNTHLTCLSGMRKATYMIIENLYDFIEDSHVIHPSLQNVHNRSDIFLHIALGCEGDHRVPEHIHGVVGTRRCHTAVGRGWNAHEALKVIYLTLCQKKTNFIMNV